MSELRIDTYTAGDNVSLRLTNQDTFEAIQINCKKQHAKKLRKLAKELLR